jgi:hypothetical protein
MDLLLKCLPKQRRENLSYWILNGCPVTDQYVTRSKNIAISQYTSTKSTLERTLHRQRWTVSQKNFMEGARSLNEKDLHDNLAYFKVPEEGIESIRIKLALKIFDEYAIF